MAHWGTVESDSPIGRRRQQRGEERRQQLVEATLRIIEEDGLEGVTHRRVADAAGVPLAATTYYFSSKEDLMQAAMETLIAREAANLRLITDLVLDRGSMSLEEGIEAIIAWQADLLRHHRMQRFAEFELYLRVARTAPRPDDLPDWPHAFHEVASAALGALGLEDPDREAQATVALIHGLVLHGLVSKDADYIDQVFVPILRSYFAQRFPDAQLGASGVA
jgi:DNA-binding transcriptional regulator YbjK